MSTARRRTTRFLALFTVVLAVASAQEPPGPRFERWVRTTFFEGFRPAGPAQRWDIPPEANRAHGGVGVLTRAVRSGAAVDLGEALRHYEIVEPFLLVVGFWRQEGDRPRLVNITAAEVAPDLWRRLWAPVTYADLRRLDDLIRDPARPVDEARRLALQAKNAPPFSQSVIQLNPKLDDQGPRRLQCSVRSADFFRHLAPGADPGEQEAPALWGVPFPGLAEAPR